VWPLTCRTGTSADVNSVGEAADQDPWVRRAGVVNTRGHCRDRHDERHHSQHAQP
jgi:hypothetical protein